MNSYETISTSSLDTATTGDQGDAPAGPWGCKRQGDRWVVFHSTEAGQYLFRVSERDACIARNRENETWRKNKVRDAADDLLNACKDCLEGRGDWGAAMSAAIAKAEGL